MTEANLHRCINNNRIEASALEKIAIHLQIPISTFFNRALEPLEKELLHCKEIIELQNMYINATKKPKSTVKRKTI